MRLHTSHSGVSDRGRVRERNEDNWCAFPDLGLYVVSDGLGGHFAGELASKIVVETLPALVRKQMSRIAKLDGKPAARRLYGILSELSRQIHGQTQHQPGFEGMGATVALAIVRGDKALIAHLGDSRVYLLRKALLRQLTKDHSVVQLLLDRGEVTPDEALTHPARGQVTRSMGMEGDALPEIQMLELAPADRLMLCTDGLTRMVLDNEIAKLLLDNCEPEAACRALIHAANEAGGHDNITVVIIDWHEPSQ